MIENEAPVKMPNWLRLAFPTSSKLRFGPGEVEILASHRRELDPERCSRFGLLDSRECRHVLPFNSYVPEKTTERLIADD